MQNKQFDQNTDNQKWYFQRVTLHPYELEAAWRAAQWTSHVSVRHMFDDRYLCIPKALVKKVWEEYGVKDHEYRDGIYDCESSHAPYI